MKSKITYFALIAVAFLAINNHKANAQVGVSTTVNIGASASTSTNGGTDSGNMDANVDSGLNITISSPIQVQSENNLEAYATVVSENDTSVNAISTTDNEVEVKFKRPAKLFGFISVNMEESAKVRVDESGKESVTVRGSWWSFLAKKDTRSDELSANIKAKLNARGSLSADSQLSARTKAEIISDIQASSDATYNK